MYVQMHRLNWDRKSIEKYNHFKMISRNIGKYVVLIETA